MAQSGGANDGAADSVGDGGGPLVPAVTGAGTPADGGQPTASFWDVFKATVNSPKQEYRESLITFVRQPCFRESMSWGLGVGSLFAIHRFKQDCELLEPAGKCNRVVLVLSRKQRVRAALRGTCCADLLSTRVPQLKLASQGLPGFCARRTRC